MTAIDPKLPFAKGRNRPKADVDQLQSQCLLCLCIVTNRHPDISDRC